MVRLEWEEDGEEEEEESSCTKGSDAKVGTKLYRAVGGALVYL